MTDPGLNNLLKWGIQNSEASRGDAAATNQPPPSIDAEALQQLLYGNRKTDADRMKESMEVILDEEVPVDDRVTAFDNFEQMIENLDNANNIENLKLWTPLVQQLENKEAEIREMAAWCCATAVANNIRTQERLLIVGALPTLVRMATSDPEKAVRKKAILAVSSSIRNFQAGLDEVLPHLPDEHKPEQNIDANDMGAVDVIINNLRATL